MLNEDVIHPAKKLLMVAWWVWILISRVKNEQQIYYTVDCSAKHFNNPLCGHKSAGNFSGNRGSFFFEEKIWKVFLSSDISHINSPQMLSAIQLLVKLQQKIHLGNFFLIEWCSSGANLMHFWLKFYVSREKLSINIS